MNQPDNGDEACAPEPKRNISSCRGLIGVIHVETSTVYFSVYNATDFRQLLVVKEPIQLFMPRDGWFEEDAEEIMTAVYQCVADVCCLLPSQGHDKGDIICVGITNQRETTVMWNSKTGQPLYRAIAWNDIRTHHIADNILSKLSIEQKDLLKKLSGLPMSPYFSALKIRWMMDNVPDVRMAMKKGTCKVGTLDTWIVWNLTRGKYHITDVTNASRTMLMNIKTLAWDPELLKVFGITESILPDIRSSSEVYGRITSVRCVLKEVFICGIIGDQQASLVGQLCLERGQANCNYNVGCFVLCNTGLQLIETGQGLLTTVAYKMGPNAHAVYAVEGSIAVGGRAFDWLATKVQILPNANEAEMYAKSVPTTAGVYFVPAFTGLYAPYWCRSARGVIVGLTRTHTAKHIVRAAHEAICYQVRDIIECICKECKLRPSTLYTDGKYASNKTLMQLQANIAGMKVSMSTRPDRTLLGAAMCAAHAYSFDLTTVNMGQNATYVEFFPTNSRVMRDKEYRKWHRAVEHSKNWANIDYPPKKTRWLLGLLFATALLSALIALIYAFNEKYDLYNSWKDGTFPEFIRTIRRQNKK